MNKIIKFKAKSIEENKAFNIKIGDWIFGSYVNNNFDLPYIILDGLISKEIKVDKDTLGQFIGKHDINNVEMYDGDILKCTSKHQGITANYAINLSDIMNPIPFSLELNFEGKTYSDYYSIFEVIGNYHDNK
jgi:hypothetical protein